jgi:N-acetylmuramoyl-L-alanine amidase
MRIAISAGHALKVRGAAGPQPWGLDEVNEARRIMPEIANYLDKLGHDVETWADDVSTTQNENLNRICNWHNEESFSGNGHDLDISIHLNAYIETSAAMGCEVEYLTQKDLADRISAAISNASGLINRGARYRTDLFVLNNTVAPCVLLECCFVDSKCDADLWRKYFDPIARAIAMVGNKGRPQEYQWEGLVSFFGGPDDSGVSPSEGLAFIYEVDDQPDLFLPEQPPGTTGLARRLDPEEDYVALRWNYDQTPREMLLQKKCLVRAPKTGKEFLAFPADWGPADWTERVADISPGLMMRLGIQTDDEVQIIFPAPER